MKVVRITGVKPKAKQNRVTISPEMKTALKYLAYSSGLRQNELVELAIREFVAQRMEGGGMNEGG